MPSSPSRRPSPEAGPRVHAAADAPSPPSLAVGTFLELGEGARSFRSPGRGARLAVGWGAEGQRGPWGRPSAGVHPPRLRSTGPGSPRSGHLQPHTWRRLERTCLPLGKFPIVKPWSRPGKCFRTPGVPGGRSGSPAPQQRSQGSHVLQPPTPRLPRKSARGVLGLFWYGAHPGQSAPGTRRPRLQDERVRVRLGSIHLKPPTKHPAPGLVIRGEGRDVPSRWGAWDPEDEGAGGGESRAAQGLASTRRPQELAPSGGDGLGPRAAPLPAARVPNAGSWRFGGRRGRSPRPTIPRGLPWRARPCRRPRSGCAWRSSGKSSAILCTPRQAPVVPGVVPEGSGGLLYGGAPDTFSGGEVKVTFNPGVCDGGGGVGTNFACTPPRRLLGSVP